MTKASGPINYKSMSNVTSDQRYEIEIICIPDQMQRAANTYVRYGRYIYYNNTRNVSLHPKRCKLTPNNPYNNLRQTFLK